MLPHCYYNSSVTGTGLVIIKLLLTCKQDCDVFMRLNNIFKHRVGDVLNSCRIPLLDQPFEQRFSVVQRLFLVQKRYVVFVVDDDGRFFDADLCKKF